MNMKVINTITVASLGRLPLASQTGTFMPNGEEREHKPGQMASDGGYVVTQTPAKVTATINQLGSITAKALGDLTDDTITINFTDGTESILENAWTSEMPEVTADGTMEVSFMANISR